MNIDKTVFIADGAQVAGDKVTVGAGSSIWYNAVIRNSGDEEVVIGKDTNIQDLCMVHTGHGYSVSIGDGVTVGHSCIIHGCTIGDNTLIGMGSIVMNGAVVGKNCIIGAGSLITEGKVIPDGSMAFGRPAKVIKELTEEQIEAIRFSADTYIQEVAEIRNAGNR